MSRKKTPKSKGASAPAASALPAANGSRPARPGTGRPGPQARPNGPPQPDRPSLGGGDFYDVAFKVSRPPPHASAAGGARPEPSREGREGEGGPRGPGAGSPPKRHPAAGTADNAHRTHTQLSDPDFRYSTAGKACPLTPQLAGPDKGS